MGSSGSPVPGLGAICAHRLRGASPGALQTPGPGSAPRSSDSRCSPVQLPKRVNYINKYKLQRELEHAVVSSPGFNERPIYSGATRCRRLGRWLGFPQLCSARGGASLPAPPAEGCGCSAPPGRRRSVTRGKKPSAPGCAPQEAAGPGYPRGWLQTEGFGEGWAGPPAHGAHPGAPSSAPPQRLPPSQLITEARPL